MTDAAMDADYVDLKFIKSRKVCQVVVEIPIERGDEFVKKFGTPSPATGVPVALARLQDSELKQQLKASVEHEKKKWADMPRSQQAACAGSWPDFRQFLDCRVLADVETEDAARSAICLLTGVISRTELDTSEEAAARWDYLYSQYELEKRGART